MQGHFGMTMTMHAQYKVNSLHWINHLYGHFEPDFVLMKKHTCMPYIHTYIHTYIQTISSAHSVGLRFAPITLEPCTCISRSCLLTPSTNLITGILDWCWQGYSWNSGKTSSWNFWLCIRNISGPTWKYKPCLPLPSPSCKTQEMLCGPQWSTHLLLFTTGQRAGVLVEAEWWGP